MSLLLSFGLELAGKTYIRSQCHYVIQKVGKFQYSTRCNVDKIQFPGFWHRKLKMTCVFVYLLSPPLMMMKNMKRKNRKAANRRKFTWFFPLQIDFFSFFFFLLLAGLMYKYFYLIFYSWRTEKKEKINKLLLHGMIMLSRCWDGGKVNSMLTLSSCTNIIMMLVYVVKLTFLSHKHINCC